MRDFKTIAEICRGIAAGIRAAFAAIAARNTAIDTVVTRPTAAEKKTNLKITAGAALDREEA